MNNLDKDYLALCQDILDNGTKKQTRTGTDAISIFGRHIRHKMSDGFPLLTTKKMAWKQIVTELLWFLRGDTNIKFLLDNDCHIWDGDAYKNYLKWFNEQSKVFVEQGIVREPWTKEQYIEQIKLGNVDSDLSELGPIYGKQWRNWMGFHEGQHDILKVMYGTEGREHYLVGIDQIANLIYELKTNPDSRRLMVSAWNVSELDQMVLPPCHYGFQVYTRELSFDERHLLYCKSFEGTKDNHKGSSNIEQMTDYHNSRNIPTRAISLMWNQRSVDVPLGLPFNIASYGLLLHILAEVTNMIPDELIGNLGDCHIYENQIDGIKEQMGRELSDDEQRAKCHPSTPKAWDDLKEFTQLTGNSIEDVTKKVNWPTRTREPYPLPTLNINTEFWPTVSGQCGVGPLVNNMDWLMRGIEITDFQIENYQSHPSIKMPLSN